MAYCAVHGRTYSDRDWCPACTAADQAWDDEEAEEEDLFEQFDCAMDWHGACGKAGSEECEFECPFNRH